MPQEIPAALTWTAVAITLWFMASRPGRSHALGILSGLLLDAGLFRAAQALARIGLRLAPQRPVYSQVICNALLARQDHEQLAAVAAHAVEQHPGDAALKAYLGVALCCSGDTEQGMRLVAPVVDGRGLSRRLRLHVGLALLEQEKTAAAARLLTRVHLGPGQARLTRAEHGALNGALGDLGLALPALVRPVLRGLAIALHVMVAVVVLLSTPMLASNAKYLALANRRGSDAAWAGRLVASHRQQIGTDLAEGRYVDALNRWQMLRDSFYSSDEAQILVNVEEAGIYQHLGDFHRAEALILEAQRLIADLDSGLRGWHPLVAHRLAALELKRPQPDLARAREYLEAAQNPEAAGRWQRLQTRRHLSDDELEEAYDLANGRADLLGVQALLAEMQSDPARASMLLEHRLQALEHAARFYRVWFLADDARTLRRYLSFSGGVWGARRLVVLKRKMDESFERGLARARLAQILSSLGDLPAGQREMGPAAEDLERFLKLQRQLVEADAVAFAGDPDRVDRGVELLDRVWQAESELAEAHAAEGRFAQACQLSASAVERLETIRSGLPTHGRAFFPASESRELAYRRAVRFALAAEQTEEAFVAFERSRSRYLLDQLASEPRPDAHGSMRDLWTGPLNPDEARAALTAEGRRFHKALVDLVTRKPGRGGVLEIPQPTHELRRAQVNLLLAYPFGSGPARTGGCQPVSSVAQVQEILRTDEALLTYFVGDRAVTAMLVSRAGLLRFDVPMTPADLEQLSRESVRRLNMAPHGSPRGDQIAERLGAALLEPLLPHLEGAKRLFIAPSGILQRLSFAVLHINGQSALELLPPIAYVPSASYLVAKRGQPTEAADRDPLLAGPGLVVADPFGDLPGSRGKEADVARRHGTRVLVGGAATEGEVKAAMGDIQWLHLGTHGYVDAHEPLFSAVLFRPSSKDDGILTIEELINSPDQGSLRLVTMAACDTAVSEFVFPGDEYLTLGRAFLATGADAVVAAFWMIPDTSTSRLLSLFYELLDDGRTVDQALHEAQATMRSEGAQAYSYGGFGVFGAVD